MLFKYQSTFAVFQRQDIDRLKDKINFVPFSYYGMWAQKVLVDGEYESPQKGILSGKNVSLAFWSLFLLLSVLLNRVWDWANIWILLALLLPKWVLTIIQKREIVQWKQRIFKRGFIFMDNPSALFHRVSKTFITTIASAVICFKFRAKITTDG